MRRISVIFFLLSSIGALAQVEHDSTTIVYAWRLDNFYSRTEEVPLDTLLTNFQLYNPLYQHSISNSFLGNLGSPGQSNIFTERFLVSNSYFLNLYYPYFYTIENTQFYNTKRPFSRLTYTFGPNITDLQKEETFEAFHTQNITSKLNFGFRYHNISSRGQYRYLQVKKNAFRLFTSYSGDKYSFHAAFNLNRYQGNENGGINESMFKTDTSDHVLDITTSMRGTPANEYDSYAKNRVRYYDLLVSQRLKLFTLASKVDSSDISKGRNIAEPILTYVFKMDRATKTYSDLEPEIGYYERIYFNTDGTLDSLTNYNLSNTLQLEFKSTFRRKVQTGIYGLIGNEFEKYANYSKSDTSYSQGIDTLLTPFLLNNNDTLKGVSIDTSFNSSFVSVGVYGNFWKKVWANFSGTYYLTGRRQNQFRLEGILNTHLTVFNKDFEFDITGLFENKTPSYLLGNYYSNHYIWNNDMKPENSYRLSSVIRNPSKKFELKGNYHVLRNFIYYNQDALPENYGQILNYFSVEATRTFKIWKIYSLNRIVYQVSENQNVLPLPKLILYNSTYIDHTFKFSNTKGEIQTILGIDIYYNSMFYGYEYSPALSQFYVQDETKIGNFPMMDAFFCAQLKRVRFFVKLQHFNSSWTGPNYYSAIHYPYNKGLEMQDWKFRTIALKFGLSWTFYE